MKLTLPKIDEQPDPSVEVRAVYVEEWIEGLAYANPPRLLEQLLQNVEALNSQPLRPALRLQLLELHVAPYCFALNFRREQRAAMTGAALASQRSISTRLRRTAIAIAVGYKQALSESTGRQSRFAGGRELRVLLQRSTLFTGLALLHCYDAYRTPVPGLWNEFITVYNFAAKEDLAGRSVASPAGDELFSRSTEHLFKRLCLTSLVDPYHLAHGELWQVLRAFGDLTEGCRVLRAQEITRPAGFFVIEPGSDRRPAALGRYRQKIARRCRLLDANVALHALENQHRSGKVVADLPARVMAAMIRALGLPPRRHTPRETSEGRVVLSVGLSTTHHFLSGGDADCNAPPIEEHSNEIHIRGATGDLDFTASYGCENWDIVDEGPGGLGVSRSAPPKLPLGVGDLVGLQFPLRGDSREDWTIAVVRWIHIPGQDRQLAGLQILSPQAVPLMVHLESLEDTVTRVPSPALALPAIDRSPNSTIALSRGLFAPGSLIRIADGARSVLLRLGASTEATGSFERFAFAIQDGS